MLRGFYVRLGDTIDESVNVAVQRLTDAVLAQPHPALSDVIPGYTTLYLEYDARQLDEAGLKQWLGTLPKDVAPAAGRTLTMPVTYDGPDLQAVAERTGLTPAEVVRRHASRPYRVYATGFTPGLAFMGVLEPALQVPRRPSPRPRVDAGTVAIANAQTTIYPVASPGGWNLIGRAHRQVYDPLRPEPLLFSAGDRVQFVPSKDEPPQESESLLELLPREPRYPLLRVQEAGLLDLVVDRGRFLAGRFGFARSGPLDASAAALANRLLGNPLGAAVLELNLSGGVYEVLSSGVIAVCGGGLRPLVNGQAGALHTSFAVTSGDTLTFRPLDSGSRAYLAAAGGLEAGAFRGSASTDLRGRIGRALQPGDLLGVSEPRAVRAGRSLVPFYSELPLRLLPGPQASGEALEALTRQSFRVGRSDRMGLKLLGAEVPGGEVISEAVPLGSVQVPPSGTPMLLLNDRGTLGGYAKPAILHPSDLPRAAQLRPGEAVRFRLS